MAQRGLPARAVLVAALLLHSVAAAAVAPSIVLILTDDQDVLLNSMAYMPQTRSLIVEQGATLPWAFTAVPVCCPSRSSLLTGRYQHNTNVKNNSLPGNCSSALWQQGPEKLNFATYLKSAGYATSFAGKLLNMYGLGPGGPAHILPGWDNWQALVGNSVFYDYTLSNNGTAEKHGNDYATDYLPTLIGNRSVDFITRNSDLATPLAVMISTPSCHQPADPAPQYAALYPDVVAPRLPNFNIRVNNTHWFEEAQGVYGLDANSIAFIDLLHRRRLQTLATVDDIVAEVVAALAATGRLENTYIIYTSDNGYHLGEAGLGMDKRNPWDFDARVPFFIRGPGIPANVTLPHPVSLVDIAPTLLQLAGVPIPTQMDGLSLLPLLLTGDAAASESDGAGRVGGGDVLTRDTIFYSYHGEVAGGGPVKVCPVRDPDLYCFEESDFDTPPHFNGSAFCSCQDTMSEWG